MIQRNKKLLNGMIPRKSGRDAISVGKVPKTSKQLRRGGRGADWSVKVLGCLRRKRPVQSVPSNASFCLFPFLCWGHH